MDRPFKTRPKGQSTDDRTALQAPCKRPPSVDRSIRLKMTPTEHPGYAVRADESEPGTEEEQEVADHAEGDGDVAVTYRDDDEEGWDVYDDQEYEVVDGDQEEGGTRENDRRTFFHLCRRFASRLVVLLTVLCPLHPPPRVLIFPAISQCPPRPCPLPPRPAWALLTSGS